MAWINKKCCGVKGRLQDVVDFLCTKCVGCVTINQGGEINEACWSSVGAAECRKTVRIGISKNRTVPYRPITQVPSESEFRLFRNSEVPGIPTYGLECE